MELYVVQKIPNTYTHTDTHRLVQTSIKIGKTEYFLIKLQR